MSFKETALPNQLSEGVSKLCIGPAFDFQWDCKINRVASTSASRTPAWLPSIRTRACNPALCCSRQLPPVQDDHTLKDYHSSNLDPNPFETGDTFYAALAITVQSVHIEIGRNFQLPAPRSSMSAKLKNSSQTPSTEEPWSWVEKIAKWKSCAATGSCYRIPRIDNEPLEIATLATEGPICPKITTTSTRRPAKAPMWRGVGFIFLSWVQGRISLVTSVLWGFKNL